MDRNEVIKLLREEAERFGGDEYADGIRYAARFIEMMVEPTVLHLKSVIKDGGSKLYADADGNEYWQCWAIGSRNEGIYGKLLKGGLKGDKPEIAHGKFILVEQTRVGGSRSSVTMPLWTEVEQSEFDK